MNFESMIREYDKLEDVTFNFSYDPHCKCWFYWLEKNKKTLKIDGHFCKDEMDACVECVKLNSKNIKIIKMVNKEKLVVLRDWKHNKIGDYMQYKVGDIVKFKYDKCDEIYDCKILELNVVDGIEYATITPVDFYFPIDVEVDRLISKK